jgi:signal transduction histidine kinase
MGMTTRYLSPMNTRRDAHQQTVLAPRPNGRRDAHARALAEVRELERVFAGCEWEAQGTFTRARKRARARALEILEGAGPGPDATRTALLVAAAELCGAVRSEFTASPNRAAIIVSELEERIGLSRMALAREVLRAPELLTLTPSAAVAAQLATLCALAPSRSVSLWTLDEAEHVQCTRYAGAGAPSRGARQLAQRILAGHGCPSDPRRLLLGMPLGRWRQPLAALVVSARPGAREACHAFMVEAAPMLGAILEREALLAANAAAERALVESSERKLTRLGFDLHDGPLQDVAVFAEDLRLLRAQLESHLESPKGHEPPLAALADRMTELDEQVLALDRELRRISNEVRAASVLLNRPFTGALRDIARSFAARTGIEPRVVVEGDTSTMSASQQIALLNISQEALSNIREHSSATKVKIAVSANEDGVEAQVVDNGQGFDLEQTLIRSARTGHLGLVAMHERARLLGGQCRIDSRPGGPTTVSVSLERWDPVSADGAQEQLGTRR